MADSSSRRTLPAVTAGRLYGVLLGWLIVGARRVVGRPTRPLGPGPTLGVIVGAHIVVLSFWTGPFAVVAGLASGTVAALGGLIGVRSRVLDPGERALAERVFGAGDWLDDVVLTDLRGRGGRAFTFPGVDGRTYLNLGSAFGDAAAYTSRAYPTPGQLLVHELAHAEQLARMGPTAFLRAAIEAQVRYELGEDVYGIVGTSAGEDLLDIERAATVVDRRYADTALTGEADRVDGSADGDVQP